MDASEVVEAFSKLKKDRKVLHFGVSNFLPSQFDLLSSFLDFPLVTNQISFSLLDLAPLENGTLNQCQKLKIQPMIWSPMSGGKIFRWESDQIHRIHRTIIDIGNSLPNASIDQIILAWLLKHPSNPIPLLGTGKLERLQNAVEATQLTLTREQWYQLLEASVGSEVP
jgi:predicted oxidoreductase